MKQESGRYILTLRYPIRILIIIGLLALLSRVFGGDEIAQPVKQKNATISQVQKENIASRIASNYGMVNFESSLIMKENVDFLLTPALLVQEAISDHIIITYPSE